MNVVCYESSSIDSVYHIACRTENENRYIEFMGTPSVHEHIVINDNCAVITFEVDGRVYEYDGNMVCGKFTQAPKIRAMFKDTDKKLIIIRITSCGLYNLTAQPASDLINQIVPESVINIEIEENDGKTIRISDSGKTVSAKDKQAYCLTQEIIRYVNENFAQLPANATNEIAKIFAISESSLRRYFKKYLGMNLSTYIITLKRNKMVRAIYDDKYDSLSVRENGYYDQSHFLNDFKRLYGVPFKQYCTDIQEMKKHDPDLIRFLYHCNLEEVL